MSEEKKMCLKIHGKVQGVFFRDSTRKKARELNINGFVENLNDGTVYLEAEGKEEDLEKLEQWCNDGPASADVTKVEKSFREPTGFSSFQVRY